MITQQHWDVFRWVEQEKKGYKATAEIMGIEYKDVKRLLTELRLIEPDLFPIETEKRTLERQMLKSERKRLNLAIVSFDARKDETDDVDSEIKEKF